MSLSQRDFAVVRTLRRNEEASFVISTFPDPSYFFSIRSMEKVLKWWRSISALTMANSYLIEAPRTCFRLMTEQIIELPRKEETIMACGSRLRSWICRTMLPLRENLILTKREGWCVVRSTWMSKLRFVQCPRESRTMPLKCIALLDLEYSQLLFYMLTRSNPKVPHNLEQLLKSLRKLKSWMAMILLI